MRIAPILLAPALLAQSYFPKLDHLGGWRTAPPAKAGLDAARLDQAFEFAKRSSAHGGLLVARNGYLVYEKYFGQGHRDAHPDMASIGKAFTSVSVGILLGERRDAFPDGLDQKVFNEKYLPEALPLNDPRKADIRLGHLLSMSSGMHGDGANPGFVKFVPSKLDPMTPATDPLDLDGNAVRVPMWTAPGEGYSYSSSSPHLASMILRRFAGMEMQQYIDEKLAKPMGFGEWGYALYRRGGKLPHTPGGRIDRGPRDRRVALCVPVAAKGHVGIEAACVRRLRRAVREAVEVQRSLALRIAV